MVKPKFSWEYNKERFPDQRINWHKLSRSNKRYAIEQYNKARLNRGHAPIPNPFKDGGETHRLKAGTALAAKFPSFVGVETITPVSDKTSRIYPKSHKEPVDSVVKYLTQPVEESIDEFSDDELATLLKTPSFIKLLEKIDQPSSSSSVSDPLVTPGTSGVTTEKNTTTRDPLDETLESPFKKVKFTSTPIKDSDMSNHPGTGRGSDMEVDNPLNETMRSNASVNIGAGHGTSGGLAMEKGDVIPDVPRPYNFRMIDGFGHIKNAFSVVSYGFASKLIPHPGNPSTVTTTTAFAVLATTPLLEIPWDRVHMYINPGVYDSLPIGTYVKSVHCKVIQRNIRVAFETAASTTTLATLNQNKFTLTALGLNNKNDIRVTNMRYKVDSVDTAMVPTEVLDPKYDDIDECLYGYPQSNPNFNGSGTGANLSAIPVVNFSFNNILHPRNYLVAWNYGYKTAATTVSPKDRGWYNLSSHVYKTPTGKVIDKEIINQSYYPTYAPLKGQLEFAEYLRDTLNVNPPSGTTVVPVVLNSLSFTDHNIGKQFDRTTLANVSARADANPTESQANVTTDRNSYTLEVSRLAYIEKGQYYKQIDADSDGKYVQPSIHIGVAAVPKLTTATDQLMPSEFTDVQSYFDVELSMVIGFNYSHQNTYQNVFNVNSNEVRMSYNTNAVGQRPTDKLPNRFGHQAIY